MSRGTAATSRIIRLPMIEGGTRTVIELSPYSTGQAVQLQRKRACIEQRQKLHPHPREVRSLKRLVEMANT